MITPDNDTLYAEEQNSNQTNAEKSETRKAMIAKILASAGAGMATGAGGAYAAVRFAESKDVDEPTEEAVQDQDTAEQQTAEPTEPTVEERLTELEEKEHMREQHEQELRQQEDALRHREEELQRKEEELQQQEEKTDEKEDDNQHNDDYFRNHDVKVESSEMITLEDGSRIQIYDATVDGHDAVFLGDENGHIVGAVIDENGNGTPEENEMVDLRQYNITEQQLSVHQVSEPVHDVDVVAVEHDVVIDGQLTDVAAVTIDDEPVLFVDTNQNNEVDLAISDQNHNNQIDENEIEDISGYHIAMPTEDDVTGTLLSSTDDNTDDYSNDANVGLYEV